MIATILWRMAGSPVVNYAMNFADVPQDQWYSEAIRWAASEGIVGGYGNGLFGTNDPITREQFAAMLYQFAQARGYDVSVGEIPTSCPTRMCRMWRVRHPGYAVGGGRWHHQRHRRRLHPQSPGPGHPGSGGGDAYTVLRGICDLVSAKTEQQPPLTIGQRGLFFNLPPGFFRSMTPPEYPR